MKSNGMTQLDIVRKQLMETGKVSRNWCLERYITRLSARIQDLEKEGLKTDGKSVKTEFGRDFVYQLKLKNTLW